MFGLHSHSSADKHLQKAAKLRLEGKDEKAREILQKAAQEIPDSPQILIQLGTLLFQMDQHKSGCAAFKKAHSLFPSERPELLSIIESLHVERGRPVESAELLLELYADQRRFEHAERVLSSLEEPQIRSILSRYDRAYRNSSKSETSALHRTATLAYILIAVYSALHDYTKSFQLMEEIISFQPSERESVLKEARRLATREWSNASILISLGDLYARNGEDDDACGSYMRAAEADSSRTREVMEKLEPLFSKRQSQDLVHAMIKLSISLADTDRVLDLTETLKTISTERQEVGRLYGEATRIDPSSFRAHLSLGDHYFEDGRLDSAASEYSKAVEIRPDAIEEVVTRLEKLLEREPANPRVLEMVFEVCASKGKTDAAVRFLEAAYDADRGLGEEIVKKLTALLDSRLDHSPGLGLLGRIYTDRGDFERAVPVLSYLSQISREGAEDALPLLATIVERNPERLESSLSLGDAKLGLNEFDEALDVYSQAMDAHPDRASSIVPRVDLLLRNKRSLAPRAVELYGKKDYLDPFVRHYATAEALALAQNYTEAAGQLVQCIATLPQSVDHCVASYYRMLEETENPDVRLGLADAFVMTGRYDAAMEEMNRVATLAPERLSDVLQRLYRLKVSRDGVWVREAIVRLLVGNRLYSEAREEIESAQQAFPEESGTWHLALGRVNQESGLFDQVIPEVARAMERNHLLAPQAVTVLEKQKALDKVDLACLIALARAHTLSSNSRKAVDTLAAIAQEYPERIDWVIRRLEDISEEEPTNPLLSFVKGRLLLDRGDVDEAVADLVKACNLDSSLRPRVEKMYLTALERSPDDSAINLALARLEIEKGLLEEPIERLTAIRKRDSAWRGPVIREFRRMIDRDPVSVHPVRALTDLYMDEGKYEPSLELLAKLLYQTDEELTWAVEHLREVYSRLPENPLALRLMAHATAASGDMEASYQLYEKLIEVETGGISSILTDLKRLSDQSPDDSGIHFIHARMLSKAGFLDRACDTLRHLAVLDPSQEESIVDELESLRTRVSEPEEPSLLLGEILLRRHQYSRAVEVLSFGLEQAAGDEKTVDFHILLSDAHRGNGKKRKASKEIRMARSCSESEKHFYQRLSQLRQERMSAAITRCRVMLEEKADDAIRLTLSTLLRKSGELNSAIELLKTPFQAEFEKRRLLELALCFIDRGELFMATRVLLSNSMGSPPDREDLIIIRVLATLHIRLGASLPAIACLRILREAGVEADGVRRLLEKETTQVVLLQHGKESSALIGEFPRTGLTL